MRFWRLIPGMNSFLLIIELPKPPASEHKHRQAEWLDFLQKLELPSSEGDKKIQRIAPNVWQIPSGNGLTFLCKTAALANQKQYPCRVLAFDEEPQWILGLLDAPVPPVVAS
jgi:hypothetical protein